MVLLLLPFLSPLESHGIQALSRISPVTIPTSEPQPPLCRNLPLPPTLPPLSDYCIPLPLCVRFVCIRVIHFPRNISSCAAWIATRTARRAKRPSSSSSSTTRCVSTLLLHLHSSLSFIHFCLFRSAHCREIGSVGLDPMVEMRYVTRWWSRWKLVIAISCFICICIYFFFS